MDGKKTSAMLAIISSALLLTTCGAPDSSHTKPQPALLIPVGRTSVTGAGAFKVLVDSESYEPEIEYDGYGGYWARVPVDLQGDAQISIQFTIVDKSPEMFQEEDKDMEKWLLPSTLINSDDAVLTEKARELTEGIDGTIDKASRIHAFVIDHLEFELILGHFRFSASETFAAGKGTCVNHARLFVALCRAAGVPARTVWGIIYGSGGVYDYHHEWAEFMDDDGYWHPLDLTFTTSFDLSDIRYLDLIYASEENPLYERSRTKSYKQALEAEEAIIYDTTLTPYDGRLGFQLVSDDRPSSIVIENRFSVRDLSKLIPHKVP